MKPQSSFRIHQCLFSLTALACLTSARVTFSQQNAAKPDTTPNAQTTTTLASKLTANYKKPKISAPDLRESQAMRGGSAKDKMQITLLTPSNDETGFVGTTLNPSPSLYWIQNQPCSGKIEVSITDVKSSTPIFKFRNKGQVSAGLNRVDLKQHNVVLQPGRDYKWSVIYHADRNDPSANLVLSTTLTRLPGDMPPDGANVEERGMAFSDKGAWLDLTDLLATEAIKDKSKAGELTQWLSSNGLVKPR